MSVTLTVLGSSDAFNASGRGHSCYLLDDARGALAIDFGPTAMVALKRFGRDPNELDGVLLTHLHGDHFGGLHTLLIDAFYRGRRTRPFTIAGPPGTAERVQALFALAYRTVARQPPPFTLSLVEYAPGDRLTVLGRTVQVFQADHQTPPDEVACVLRVETGDRVITFSGDTGWTDALIAASDQADLFLCECTTFDAPVSQHIAWIELEPQLPRLRAKRVMVTHLSEQMRAHADELRQGGRVEVAEDGLKLVL